MRFRYRGVAWVVFSGLLGLLCLPIACGERDQRAAPQVAERAQPALRLVALTDISGYLEPCGCQSRPLGGIDRAAAKLAALRADRVPVLFVAAGDLLFGDTPEGARGSAQATTQETWKAETMVEILNRVGLAAAAPGKRDLSFGEPELQRLIGRSTFAWLPAKPGDGTNREAVGGWLGHAGEHKVGVVGVSTFEGPEAVLPAERFQGLRELTQAQIDKLRAAGARVVVVLLSSDQRTGRRLTGSLHGVDFVVQGGLDDAQANAPSTVGAGTLLRAGRQGQGLLVVDVYLDAKGSTPFLDVSEWTRREQSTALQASIGDLSQRIATWEHDPKVQPASLQEQRSKLNTLREQLERAQRAPPVPPVQGNAFSARYEPLTVEQSRDKTIGDVIHAYDARVNDHNRVAFADLKPAEPAAGAARYVGSNACQTCHAPAYTWWTQHPHGHAYTTLERAHKQFNLSCVGCHVTGYDQPGGSTVVHNEGLIHVGCESCHGPGSRHIAQPRAASTALTKQPGEAVCKQCHTPEHSDLFEFNAYVARLRVKGHGLPLSTD